MIWTLDISAVKQCTVYHVQSTIYILNDEGTKKVVTFFDVVGRNYYCIIPNKTQKKFR